MAGTIIYGPARTQNCCHDVAKHLWFATQLTEKHRAPRTTPYSWLTMPPESPPRCCLRPLGEALSATPSCTKTRGERVLLGSGGGSGRLGAEATSLAACSPVLGRGGGARVYSRGPSGARLVPGAPSEGALFRFLFDYW